MSTLIPAKIQSLSQLVSESNYDAPQWEEYAKAVSDFATSTSSVLTVPDGGASNLGLPSTRRWQVPPNKMLMSPRASPLPSPRGVYPPGSKNLFPSEAALKAAAGGEYGKKKEGGGDPRKAGAKEIGSEGVVGGASGASSLAAAAAAALSGPGSGTGEGGGKGGEEDLGSSSDEGVFSSSSSESSSIEFSGPVGLAGEELGESADFVEAVKGMRVRSNSVIRPLSDQVKHEMYVFLDVITILRNWLQIEVPSEPEKAKVFDVNVSITLLAEMMMYEATIVAQLKGISRYFTSRGRLISRVLKRPWNADHWNSVAQLDDQYFMNLTVSFSLLLNAYRGIYDALAKNMDTLLSDKLIDSVAHS